MPALEAGVVVPFQEVTGTPDALRISSLRRGRELQPLLPSGDKDMLPILICVQGVVESAAV